MPALAEHDRSIDGGAVINRRAYDQSLPRERIAAVPAVATSYSRYSDQPTNWRTRAVGLGGTATVGLVTALCLLVTWHVVEPMTAPPSLTVVNLDSLEAPPEPAREVPEGPEQVQQEELKPKVQEPDPVPEIVVPRISAITQPTPPPVEQTAIADPVPETTAPKSIPAPPARQASSNADLSWEALIMARLEKHRRYPAAARSRGEQGVAFVTFRMNREGHVLSSRISRSSGSARLDQAALETLKRADPLPPIPNDKPSELELTVQVEFFVGR